jgi:threonine/homoserine/homoserine lactone efflux protein
MTTLSTLQIVAFCNFVAAIAFTPGPNNAIASMTGLNYGWRAALPQALGVSFGCAVLFCITAAGIGALVMALPGSSWALTLGGAAYLAWLGVGFLRTHAATTMAQVAHAPRFHEAALFQAMNPKAWIASLGGSSAWIASSHVSIKVTALLASLYGLICFPSVLTWAVAGAVFRGRVAGGGLRWFNFGAGLLLLVTAGWMVIENLDAA